METASEARQADETCHWYERVEKSGLIDQGQLLPGFPVIELSEYATLATDPSVELFRWDVIVLTQSCDFENSKAENVLLCPAAAPNMFKKIKPSSINDAKKGRAPGCHILPPCTLKGFESELRVAYFPKTISVPLEHVTSHLATLEESIVLKSPYREHLSQAFGFYIMRVAKIQPY